MHAFVKVSQVWRCRSRGSSNLRSRLLRQAAKARGPPHKTTVIVAKKRLRSEFFDLPPRCSLPLLKST